jgi:putative chitinase
MTDISIIKQLWPHGDQHVPGLLEGIIADAPAVFPEFGLDSALVVGHAMAQFSHECGAGLEMVENLNYSAEGLQRTWPTRFGPDRASRYAHNPRMIADAVYGGRMGNAPPPSDDGWNYRGRGLSQCTGREGYQKLNDDLSGRGANYSVVAEPDLINDPAHALECGVADFVLCGCLPYAKDDDVRGVTHALNGGYIGLAERPQWLARWKRALGV